MTVLHLRRSILHPKESNESFIGDSLKFIAIMLVSPDQWELHRASTMQQP